MTKTLRVMLPDDLLSEIDLLVKIGHYNSRNEVIVRALNEFLNREFVKVKNRIIISRSL